MHSVLPKSIVLYHNISMSDSSEFEGFDYSEGEHYCSLLALEEETRLKIEQIQNATYFSDMSDSDNDSTISGEDSELDTPLSKLREQYQDSGSEYVPSGGNSTDSEFEPTREKLKCNSSGHHLETAINISHKEAIYSVAEINLHYQRIENIIQTKNLRIHKVPADGDCFFKSVLPQIDQDINVELMRKKICDHFKQFKDDYLDYFACDDENKGERFLVEVEKLSIMGAWNTQIGDLLPMAAANIFDREVKVISSHPETPETCIGIDHAVGGKSQQEKPILLSYLAIPGKEHYDYLEEISGTVNLY